jgi:hypothetical protein
MGQLCDAVHEPGHHGLQAIHVHPWRNVRHWQAVSESATRSSVGERFLLFIFSPHKIA